eukprot:jgi/Chlat1/211/Chrsp1S03125
MAGRVRGAEQPPAGNADAYEVVRLLESIRIKDYLEERRMKEAEKSRDSLPSPRPVVTLQPSDSIARALAELAAADILSAPVEDPTKPEEVACYGFIDVMDILSYVLEYTWEAHSSQRLAYEEVEEFELDSAVLDELGRKCLAETQIRQLIDKSKVNPFLPVSDRGNIYQLVEEVFQKGVHRAPVVSDDGKLVGIVSQSDVIRILSQHMRKIETTATKTLGEMGLAVGDFASEALQMSVDAPAIQGFLLMLKNKASAVAVVTKDGRLLTSISASSLRGITESGLGVLLLPALEFMRRENTLHPARFRSPLTCTPHATTFCNLVLKLALFHGHRAWIVDEDDRPVGVVLLSDIMRMISS